MRRLATLAGLAAAALALGCGAGRDTAPGPFPGAPIVLISIDTLRADRLPAYGYTKVETPALDRFAREGIVVDRAYANYPLTFPSHVSIFTGQIPPRSGVRDNVGYRFEPARHPFLPLALKRAGYATAGFVSAYVLNAETGLGAGFDQYDSQLEVKPGLSLDSVQRSGLDTTARAAAWVRAQGDRPFFLFLHLYEPHAPYAPPEPYASRYPDSPYDGEIATADAIVGGLFEELKRLGIFDRAILVVLGDHGEGLGDHGEDYHGVFLYRATLQVPLMLRLPGGARGAERIGHAASLVDVAPTLAELARVDLGAEVDGRSLFAPPAPRQLYAETFYPRLHWGWSELTSLIADRHQYIEAPEPELYDLLADPQQEKNLLTDERRLYAELKAAMAGFARPLEPPQAVDAETQAKLAALGYLSGASVRTSGPLPDPKSQRHVLADVQLGIRRFTAGDFAGALEPFRRLIEGNDQMADVWGYYARALDKLERHRDAAVAWKKVIELSGGAPVFALALANSQFKAGDFEEAKQHAELALKAEPKPAYDLIIQSLVALGRRAEADAKAAEALGRGVASETVRRQEALRQLAVGAPVRAVELLAADAETGEAPTLTVLGLALSDAGRHAEAWAVLERAQAKDAKAAKTLEALGIVALRLDRPLEARTHLERALALDAKLPAAWNTLGVALYRLEGAEAALAAWQRAVALDREQFDALFNLGLVAANAGRRDLARRALRQYVTTAPRARFGPDVARAEQLLRQLGGG